MTNMHKKQVQSWMVTLEQHRKKIGKERDAIRKHVQEMEELEDCCERAYENLQHAIDALSELA